MSQTPFSTLSLPEALLGNLTDLGYHTMTPIQQKALPSILAGKDLIAQAKTGSGKTATFGLGLLAKLDVKRFRVQSLRHIVGFTLGGTKYNAAVALVFQQEQTQS